MKLKLTHIAWGYLVFFMTFWVAAPLAWSEAVQKEVDPLNGSDVLVRLSHRFAEILERAKPAVVYLHVKKEKGKQDHLLSFPDELSDNEAILKEFFRDKRSNEETAATLPDQSSFSFGSGFLLSQDGYILTNSHVVRDSEEITVTLADKRRFSARIIGEDRKTDVGLIKIEAENLPVIPLGDSDQLKTGYWVLAIGCPYASIQTVTAGIVSATGRDTLGISDYESFIQTDAAINPGNSGGPLIDFNGRAVGINTAFLSQTGGYMGVGFAIPINMVKRIYDQLLENGKVTRGWLGVALKDVTAEQLSEQAISTATQAALVVEVVRNSPAEKAGLQKGDLIVTLNEEPVLGAADIRNRIALSPPQTNISLEYFRKSEKIKTHIVIGKLAESES